MKLGIIGIAASVVAARTYTAVSRDVRTEIYSDIVAPEVKKGIIAEIDGVQKTIGVIEFDNAGDGIEEV
ncbi:9425_t:CDS:2 [Racocetra fulgida]|uniref:9425_t:CDS:1 n=1 Tax=Racocetra fulgida TaxID=60492 RepID=A0A9N8YTS3_9GLOM|nr:9425_t:CDS:2 [Racocetra fulgida]